MVDDDAADGTADPIVDDTSDVPPTADHFDDDTSVATLTADPGVEFTADADTTVDNASDVPTDSVASRLLRRAREAEEERLLRSARLAEAAVQAGDTHYCGICKCSVDGDRMTHLPSEQHERNLWALYPDWKHVFCRPCTLWVNVRCLCGRPP